MKLLFLIRALGGFAGGAERVLSEVASGLAKRGHSIEIASHDAPGSQDLYPLDPRVVRHRLGSAGVRALLRARRPDVAVGMMYSAYLPIALASAGTGIRIVASEHTAWAHYQSRPLHALLLRAAAPRFAAMTVPSERVREGYPPAVARRMTVIPNPVALGAVRRSERVRRTLLSVGNLRSEKGHAILVGAFAVVAANHPDWDLRIVGEGPERPALERQVRQLGLETRVQLAGFVRDVAAEYAAADLFAMPSAYESFGIATAEALVSGLPAIGFADCPGTNEMIVDGRNGLLVAGPDRVRALAGGLTRLMGSAELRRRLGEAGPASVKPYSLTAVTDRWEQLLASVAA